MPDLDEAVAVTEVQPARREVLVQGRPPKRYGFPDAVDEKGEQLARLGEDDASVRAGRQASRAVDLERPLQQLAGVVERRDVLVLASPQRLDVRLGQPSQPAVRAFSMRPVDQRHVELGRHLRYVAQAVVVAVEQFAAERIAIAGRVHPLVNLPSDLVGPQTPLAVAQ